MRLIFVLRTNIFPPLFYYEDNSVSMHEPKKIKEVNLCSRYDIISPGYVRLDQGRFIGRPLLHIIEFLDGSLLTTCFFTRRERNEIHTQCDFSCCCWTPAPVEPALGAN